ncbi:MULTISPECIES: hydrolase [Bacillus cereus group]|uniref:hydrolase n=1 Tax=Bacillus cereus group TaxID=86661 RepID=UPI000BFE3A6F|nr:MULTISPECIES: hydrolase [Bacillus cereus group]PGM03799.1 hydrolase [Bacillus thuringiensis]
MDSVINGKIAMLGFIPIDKKAYIKYLKPYEKACKRTEIEIYQFQYYKLYERTLILYSVEYHKQTTIIDLSERDRENQIRWGKIDE